MTLVATAVGRLRGKTDGEVHAFRGIPFGEAPIGPRRFRPPIAHGGWSGIREATQFGPRARQPDSLLASAGERESEDCLYLNVWTTGLDDELRPVMVWIHGGSFTTGSAGLSWYDGSALARRGVVVVTVNYRLGPFGFLHLEPIGGRALRGSANCGLADQALALEWVRDNIAAFGGDPTEVTLFGESAGAMSVSTHLARPASLGLFRRAIAQSGAAGHVQSGEDGEATARVVLDHLGVGDDDLDRLEHVDAEAVLAASGAALTALGRRDLPLPFRPTIDGSTLPMAPLDALASGISGDVELLCGTTADEMRLFGLVAALSGGGVALDEERLERRVARAAANASVDVAPGEIVEIYAREHPRFGPGEIWSQITTDLTFRLPAISMLDAHHRGGGRGWHYLFTHRSDAFDGSLGACHALEIPFVFDNLDQPGVGFLLGAVDNDRRGLAAGMADAWASFARGVGPVIGADEPWSEHDPSTRPTMILDIETHLQNDPASATRRVWSSCQNGSRA